MRRILLTTAIAVILTTSVFAGGTKDLSNYNEAVDNYIVGVKSDNVGLKISSAYFLGEMKAELAVIPLLRMFREETNDNAKIAAALALVKIGNPMGVYIVKQYSQLSDNERVRNMCEKFYNAYSNGKLNLEQPQEFFAAK